MILNVTLTFRSSLDEFSRIYRNMDDYQMNDFQWDEVEIFVSLLKPFHGLRWNYAERIRPDVGKSSECNRFRAMANFTTFF